MEYVIAVFRARSQTITFSNLLKSYGVQVGIISTPRKINVSCGISCRFQLKNLEIAKSIISRRRFDSFAGFYIIKQVGTEYKYLPI